MKTKADYLRIITSIVFLIICLILIGIYFQDEVLLNLGTDKATEKTKMLFLAYFVLGFLIYSTFSKWSKIRKEGQNKIAMLLAFTISFFTTYFLSEYLVASVCLPAFVILLLLIFNPISKLYEKESNNN